MGRIIKWLIILIILAGLGLVAYAYLGPLLGADFSAPQNRQSLTVTLDAQ